jgi:hypothetical protein
MAVKRHSRMSASVATGKATRPRPVTRCQPHASPRLSVTTPVNASSRSDRSSVRSETARVSEPKVTDPKSAGAQGYSQYLQYRARCRSNCRFHRNWSPSRPRGWRRRRPSPRPSPVGSGVHSARRDNLSRRHGRPRSPQPVGRTHHTGPAGGAGAHRRQSA